MPAPQVEGRSWEEFLDAFRSEWEPGQHIAIIAPTGQGKTTVLVSLLDLRNYVLAFDPKGGDDTLAKTRFPRLANWPPPAKAYDKMNGEPHWTDMFRWPWSPPPPPPEKQPVKYLVGPKIARLADRPLLAAVQAAALEGAFDDTGWTVAIDELQIAADKMGQADAIENLLISARTRKVSVVSLFQRPARVPRAAYEMASWIFLGLTLNRDTVTTLADVVGRPAHEIRGAVNGLAKVKYSWLVVPNNPRTPMVLTLPREPDKSPIGQPGGSGGEPARASAAPAR